MAEKLTVHEGISSFDVVSVRDGVPYRCQFDHAEDAHLFAAVDGLIEALQGVLISFLTKDGLPMSDLASSEVEDSCDEILAGKPQLRAAKAALAAAKVPEKK